MPSYSDASKYIPGLGSAFKLCCKDMDMEAVTQGLAEQGVVTEEVVTDIVEQTVGDTVIEQVEQTVAPVVETAIAQTRITQLADVQVDAISDVGKLLSIVDEGVVKCVNPSIINVSGTESEPIIMSDLEPGIYRCTGYGKMSADGTAIGNSDGGLTVVVNKGEGKAMVFVWEDRIATAIVASDGSYQLTNFTTEDNLGSAVSKCEKVEYKLIHAPKGTLMNVKDHELEICIPDGVDWAAYYTTPGDGGDATKCYVGVRAMAPETATKYQAFTGNPLTQISEIKALDGDGTYTEQWLPVAALSDSTWSSYADGSSADRKIGWHYRFDFYNDSNELVESKRVRIVLANPTSFNSAYEPYYISSTYAKKANVLQLNNTTEFHPTSDYHPVTKKYVDSNSPYVLHADMELLNVVTGIVPEEILPHVQTVIDGIEYCMTNNRYVVVYLGTSGIMRIATETDVTFDDATGEVVGFCISTADTNEKYKYTKTDGVWSVEVISVVTAPYVAESTATTVEELKTDLNSVIAALKSTGLMETE